MELVPEPSKTSSQDGESSDTSSEYGHTWKGKGELDRKLDSIYSAFEQILLGSLKEARPFSNARLDAMLLQIRLWANDIGQLQGTFQRVEEHTPNIARSTAYVMAEISRMLAELHQDFLDGDDERYNDSLASLENTISNLTSQIAPFRSIPTKPPPMSSPVGFGDIVRAIELCIQIREIFFDPTNSADIKYAEFQQDIINLETRLREFQNAFNSAIHHVHGLDSLGPEAALAHSSQLEKEGEELVGNFLATLEECKALSNEHSKFQKQKATAFDQLSWHMSTESKIKSLRSRIQSHTYKLWLILEPVQLNLIVDIHATVSEILELLRKHLGLTDVQLPSIPPSFATRFAENLSKNSLLQISTPAEIPLKEGVELLISHYQHSTAQFRGLGATQTVEQYFNLLKAHWLVQVLVESHSFAQTREGHLYRRVIRQVEQHIAKEYKRTEVVIWSEETLIGLNLQDSAFAIWPEKKTTRLPPITEPKTDSNYREQKLGEIPLVPEAGYEKQSLIVFRVNEHTFRLVQVQTRQDASPREQGSEKLQSYLNLRVGTVVPRYTISSSLNRRWCLDITYGHGAPPTSYEVPNRAAVFAFQKVFTAFDVATCSENVSCTVTYRESSTTPSLIPIVSRIRRNVQMKGQGDVQLWWEWDDSSDSADAPAPSSPVTGSAESSVRSFQSGSESSATSKSFRKIPPSITSVTEGNNRWTELAILPQAPLFMAFMKMEDGYMMWKIDLSTVSVSDIRSKTLELKCKKGSFPAQRLSVREADLFLWNICALALPDVAQSSDPVVENIDCTWITLTFSTPALKMDFKRKLDVVLARRGMELRQFHESRRIAEITQAQGPPKAKKTHLRSSSTGGST